MQPLAQKQQPKLPKTITKPLRRAFGLIAFALGGFVLWSIFAPLSTTVHTTGHLKALSPSFDIQHPFGGKIQRVMVREHDHVEAGQALLILDTLAERAQLRELKQQIDALDQENAYLDRRLQGKSSNGRGPRWLVHRLEAMEETAMLQVMATRSNQAALAEQAAVMAERLVSTETQLASMRDRYQDQQALVQKGSFKSTDAAILQENILALDSELNTTRSQLIAMEEQIRQSDMAADQAEHQLRTTMLDMYAANRKALPDLRRRALDLQARIDHGTIVAPSQGTVTVLAFDTDQMFAPRGETLLTLTKPSDGYQVAFEVAPQMIDQLSVGMVGQVTVTSLPQRNLPKIHAEITALSPEAQRDRDGNVVSYRGTAQLIDRDMDRLFAALDANVRLSIDMPVSVAFTGRETTFASYLVTPFLAFLDRSLQD